MKLFQRVVQQYDMLRKSGAFLNVYRKADMFAQSLDEFDESRFAFRSSLAY